MTQTTYNIKRHTGFLQELHSIWTDRSSAHKIAALESTAVLWCWICTRCMIISGKQCQSECWIWGIVWDKTFITEITHLHPRKIITILFSHSTVVIISKIVTLAKRPVDYDETERSPFPVNNKKWIVRDSMCCCSFSKLLPKVRQTSKEQ